MRLWDWAVKVHSAPGVDEALIQLQDEHGQCVSYLIWSAWTGRMHKALDEAGLARGAALARSWEAQVTGRLRAARRALKSDWAGIDETGREALRARVKADELDAERRLLEALEVLTPVGSDPGADILARMRAAGAAWTPPPAAALEALARMFADADC